MGDEPAIHYVTTPKRPLLEEEWDALRVEADKRAAELARVLGKGHVSPSEGAVQAGLGAADGIAQGISQQGNLGFAPVAVYSSLNGQTKVSLPTAPGSGGRLPVSREEYDQGRAVLDGLPAGVYTKCSQCQGWQRDGAIVFDVGRVLCRKCS